MPSWDAAQYLRFEAERTQPAIDLAARIPLEAPAKILDVGCGPGNSTAVLLRRFPGASVLGIDSSQNMIDSARKNCPGANFSLCDATTELNLLPRDFDIVFSNACLQWVPDHPQRLAELMERLAPGGVLAVQIPMNFEQPIHQIISRLVNTQKWGAKCGPERIFHTLRPEEYFDILSELSSTLSLWTTCYYHQMGGPADILEWYRGTGLRPYLEGLDEEERSAFEQDVYTGIVAVYLPRKNGTVLFPFPRFFMLAAR